MRYRSHPYSLHSWYLRSVLSADTWPTDLPRFEHLDASHSRVALPITGAPPADAATVNAGKWLNCKMVVMVAWLRQVGEKTCNLEQHYYISSRDITLKRWPKPFGLIGQSRTRFTGISIRLESEINKGKAFNAFPLYLERQKSLELSTSTLARLRSTN